MLQPYGMLQPKTACYSPLRHATCATKGMLPVLQTRATQGMLQPIAFGVSFNLNVQSQSHWSLVNGTCQKKPTELKHRLRIEPEEITLQIQ